MQIELTNEENEYLQQGLYYLTCHYLRFKQEHKDKKYQDFINKEQAKVDTLMKKLVNSEQ